jgi:hypothetical protein
MMRVAMTIDQVRQHGFAPSTKAEEKVGCRDHHTLFKRLGSGFGQSSALQLKEIA